ncbi:MAG: peptide chain release factor N(5)-glutamine methyltransferase [Acidimicrobiales bacterium]
MSEAARTWRDAVAAVAARVGDALAARWLCETASGADNADDFRSMLDEAVNSRAAAHLEAMVSRVEAGEPLQYALGRWAFRRLDLMVDRRVLIPRPETELIVDRVLAHLRTLGRAAVVVDLGTGSGAIGLSVLHETPPGSVEVWMTDESEDALDVARANAAGTGRAATGAHFAHGSWFAALPGELRGRVDVVVSNPPYVADDDPELEDTVRRWEPEGALLAGPDGLDDLREIASSVSEWLAPGGVVVVETGHTQAAGVARLLQAGGLTGAEVIADLAGRDRFVAARRG